MNMHATPHANAGRNGADRGVRRAAVAAARRRRGDGQARRCHRGDQGRPADQARSKLALHRSAPAADRGAGLRCRPPTPKPIDAAGRGLDRAAGPQRRRARPGRLSIEASRCSGSRKSCTDGSFAPALDPRGADDAIGALNTAFVADGYFVDIADGAALAAPIELQNVQAGGQTHVRLPVRVGAGAKATIVERQTGSGAALVTSVSQSRWSATVPRSSG